MNPIIMPIWGNPDQTIPAVEDCLAQTAMTHLLLIDQGRKVPTWTQAQQGTFYHLAADPRVVLWNYDPPLLSLGATWNAALRWAWEAGGEHVKYAMLVNNDIRMIPETYGALLDIITRMYALFVSATGVTPEQYEAWVEHIQQHADTPRERASVVAETIWDVPGEVFSPGHLPGPDFSCYVISKACHEKYPFDENFIPAYCEDLDYHRRLMLGGDGQRIFGTGLPFLHVGSGTLNAMDAEARMKHEARITQGSRAYYRQKWGGDVNQETYTAPFGRAEVPLSWPADVPVTTTALFEVERKKWNSR